MAGPLDIQRPPKGLVDLLGLRTMGASPQQLGGQVIGALDMLDMYGQDRRIGTQANTVAPVASSGLSVFQALNVPQQTSNTAFLVYSAWTTFFVPVGGSFQGVLIVKRAAYSIASGYTFIEQSPEVAAGKPVQIGRYFEKPLMLGPNDVFALYVNIWGAGSVSAGLWADVVPILV